MQTSCSFKTQFSLQTFLSAEGFGASSRHHVFLLQSPVSEVAPCPVLDTVSRSVPDSIPDLASNIAIRFDIRFNIRFGMRFVIEFDIGFGIRFGMKLGIRFGTPKVLLEIRFASDPYYTRSRSDISYMRYFGRFRRDIV